MQSLARKNAAIFFAAALVLISLSIANYVGWLHLKPEVSAIAWIADKPDYESHLVNMHQRATERAMGSPDSFLPIYDIQNPGFFLLVAELYVRAGATTPLPLEITSIVLFNIGAICFFFWVYLLFRNLMVAAFGTAFLALSQFFLYFPGTTHTFPFEFVFFNLTMLLFVIFLKNNRKAWLIASLVAMFMTCMNYWFYYMSSWIIMVGLWWQFRGRPGLKDLAILSAPPIAAATLTTAMVMALFGVEGGALRLASILVARTVDARIPGGAWYPNERFMFAQDWVTYPADVAYKLSWAFSFDTYRFADAAAYTSVLLWFRNRQALVSALILLLGGFSWYYVMFQHTHIHHFVGQYSFMAICPIFGLIVSETVSFGGTVLRRIATARRDMQDIARARPEAAKGFALVGQAAWPLIQIAAFALMLRIDWPMMKPWYKSTYLNVEQNIESWKMVEPKYQEAVRNICREHSKVTLEALEAASKDWGFEWRPRLITETNRTPTCLN